jgi:hypothetical protein
VRALFALLAVVFAAAAVFHGVEAALGHGVVARHALFVAVDAVVAGLLLARPPGTAIVFALLTGQQIVSHGGDLLRAWQIEHRVDPTDVGVLLVMPLTLAALVVDARRRRVTGRGRPRP